MLPAAIHWASSLRRNSSGFCSLMNIFLNTNKEQMNNDLMIVEVNDCIAHLFTRIYIESHHASHSR